MCTNTLSSALYLLLHTPTQKNLKDVITAPTSILYSSAIVAKLSISSKKKKSFFSRIYSFLRTGEFKIFFVEKVRIQILPLILNRMRISPFVI